MKVWLKATLITVGIGVVGSTAYYLLKNENGNELLTYVPNNVGILVKFDLPEIAKALEQHKKEILEFGMFKDKDLKNQDVLFKTTMNILKDPEKSGIDFSAPAMLYTESKSRGDVSALILKLKDESTFTEYMTKYIPAGAETGNEKDVHFAEIGTGNWISWNKSVVLLTDQKTEDKTYFQNILNKKNPGARGNLLLSKIVEQKGLVSAIFILDEITSSHQLSRMVPATGGIKNPLPAGSAILANLNMNNGKMEVDASVISLNEKKLAEVNIFKPQGRLAKHKDQLFNGDKEIAVYSISLDMKQLIKIMEQMTGADNKDDLTPEEKSQQDKIKETMEMFQGDLVVGVSTRSELVKDSNSIETPLPAGIDKKSVVGLIAYVSIQPKQIPQIQNYLQNMPKDKNGNYMLLIPFWDFVLKARIIGDEMVISDDANTLQQLESKSFVSPKPIQSIGLKEHLNAPFYMGITTEIYRTIGNITGNPNIAGFDLSGKLYSGPAVGYIENGKFIYSVTFRDSKVHPLMQYLRVMNETYKKEKEIEAETKEILKSMGMDNNEDY